MVELEEQRQPSPDRDGDDEIVAEGASFVHGELPQDGSGPPKVSSAVEALHEKVTKQIMKKAMVLVEDENNVKALFRCSKARAELGQTHAAREDFTEARKFTPEDKAMTKELHMLVEDDKAVYQKQKELYKGWSTSRSQTRIDAVIVLSDFSRNRDRRPTDV